MQKDRFSLIGFFSQAKSPPDKLHSGLVQRKSKPFVFLIYQLMKRGEKSAAPTSIFFVR